MAGLKTKDPGFVRGQWRCFGTPGYMGDVMTGQRKKMAAALAAVSLYLQQEEAMMAQEQQAPLKKPQSCEFSQWGQSGRQEMMSMRRLIQMRAFTRFS